MNKVQALDQTIGRHDRKEYDMFNRKIKAIVEAQAATIAELTDTIAKLEAKANEADTRLDWHDDNADEVRRTIADAEAIAEEIDPYEINNTISRADSIADALSEIAKGFRQADRWGGVQNLDLSELASHLDYL